MREHKGNMWDVPADAYVITTNGYVRKDGAAVMGRGCALEAKNRWRGLEYQLGSKIISGGNHVYVFPMDVAFLITMPVKHNWWEKADLNLIERSVKELVAEVGNVVTVVMPRPGCGNGQLHWEQVAPLLAHLDDRFIICSY